VLLLYQPVLSPLHPVEECSNFDYLDLAWGASLNSHDHRERDQWQAWGSTRRLRAFPAQLPTAGLGRAASDLGAASCTPRRQLAVVSKFFKESLVIRVSSGGNLLGPEVVDVPGAEGQLLQSQEVASPPHPPIREVQREKHRHPAEVVRLNFFFFRLMKA
ncbi:MAG: hypothetical protein ACKPKO_51005, partial [Candidatus Fonsibacter sp.]